MWQMEGTSVRSTRGGSSGRRRALLLPLVALSISACGESRPLGPTPLQQLPRELTAAEREVVAGSNDFAFALFRESNRRFGAENVILSPLSASMALGMTMNGARGETFVEMQTVLGFEGMELQEINRSYRDLMGLLLELDPGVDIRVANSVWHRETFPFEQSFFDTVREYFSAEVAGIPMVSADRQRINDWVREATAGKIPEIVDAITADHVMFLINAVYFKGSWTTRFDSDATRDASFHLANGGTTQVKMMSGKLPFGYRSMSGYDVVDLPYGNGAFAMTILLPREATGVDELAERLDAAEWQAATGSLPTREMELALPRFRVEYKQELKEALEALGMNAAFDPAAADFSGMSDDSGSGLAISRVVQKTYMDVNEEGTEAAAATSVEMEVTSMPPSIRVDRPFVVAIRERFSGAVLFIGKVVDPS